MRYFPLFADLRGRRVLVVGGGEVAERKVRLLLSAGARVTVLAPRLTRMARAAGRQLAGSTVAAPGLCRRAAGAHVSLVIAATNDRGVNATSRRRRARATCWSTSSTMRSCRPSRCPRSSIARRWSSRSRAAVWRPCSRASCASASRACSISRIGKLAGLLERWRDRIKRAVPDVGARRRFYEAALRGSVAAHVRAGRPEQAERELERQLEQRAGSDRGTVVLVGAGPGDPGLLTLNALRALQAADVILHDRLVSDEIIDLARRDATRICVGKKAGGHSVAQAAIHELMIEHARAGRRVVRLKGGDPFVFGRGGEELEALRAAGIAYEVVPGITAAIACASLRRHPAHASRARAIAAARHRALRRCTRYASTGPSSARAGRRWRSTWASASSPRSRRSCWRTAAMPTTPIAIVERGSQIEQRVTIGTLGQLADIAARGADCVARHAVRRRGRTLCARAALVRTEPRVWRMRPSRPRRRRRGARSSRLTARWRLRRRPRSQMLRRNEPGRRCRGAATQIQRLRGNSDAGLGRVLGVRDLVFLNLSAILGFRWLSTAAQMGPSSLTLWVVAALLFFVPTGPDRRRAQRAHSGRRRSLPLDVEGVRPAARIRRGLVLSRHEPRVPAGVAAVHAPGVSSCSAATPGVPRRRSRDFRRVLSLLPVARDRDQRRRAWRAASGSRTWAQSARGSFSRLLAIGGLVALLASRQHDAADPCDCVRSRSRRTGDRSEPGDDCARLRRSRGRQPDGRRNPRSGPRTIPRGACVVGVA